VYRLSGIGLFVGAVLSIISSVLTSVLFPNNDPTAATNPLNICSWSAGLCRSAADGPPMLTSPIYPGWCGWLMILEAVPAAVSFFANGPESSGVISLILNVIAPLPLFIVLGWIGWQQSR